MSALLHFGVGAATGAAQSALLRRDATTKARPFGLLLRLAGVAAVLVAAALSGHLREAAAGWAIAYGLTTLLIARRWS
ncbi:MAG: hypothetical protein PVI30_11830 [Myxococcales bacterium]